MKKRRPCILGLRQFEKTGCPQKSWDGEEGCPAWKELILSNRENPLKKENKAQCIMEWQFEFQWSMLGLLEGNQQAIETFRNGMVSTGADGVTYPKPDPAMVTLLSTIERNIRNTKRIENKEEVKEIEIK